MNEEIMSSNSLFILVVTGSALLFNNVSKG